MKKTTLILLIIITHNFSFAQITTTKVVDKKENISTVQYDSLQNFLGEDVYKYLNQELYLKGNTESLRQYGYREFLIDYEKSSGSLKNTYKPIMPDNMEYIKYDIGGGKTEYDSIAGKYFKVLKIHKDPQGSENVYYLELKEKLSGDTVYFKYQSRFKHSFPFIVVGFFNKLKETFINKIFVLGSTENRYGDKELDIKTGLPINFRLGEKWKCIDLTIDEKYYNLSFLLQDNLNQTFTLNYESMDKDHDVYPEKEAEKYKNKFGLNNWNTILRGKVIIGMTKEMCELSWGKPKDINKTISSNSRSEQWVYSDNYLYFENGILTTIQ